MPTNTPSVQSGKVLRLPGVSKVNVNKTLKQKYGFWGVQTPVCIMFHHHHHHHQYIVIINTLMWIVLFVTDVTSPNYNAYSGNEATRFTITCRATSLVPRLTRYSQRSVWLRECDFLSLAPSQTGNVGLPIRLFKRWYCT